MYTSMSQASIVLREQEVVLSKAEVELKGKEIASIYARGQEEGRKLKDTDAWLANDDKKAKVNLQQYRDQMNLELECEQKEIEMHNGIIDPAATLANIELEKMKVQLEMENVRQLSKRDREYSPVNQSQPQKKEQKRSVSNKSVGGEHIKPAVAPPLDQNQHLEANQSLIQSYHHSPRGYGDDTNLEETESDEEDFELDQSFLNIKQEQMLRMMHGYVRSWVSGGVEIRREATENWRVICKNTICTAGETEQVIGRLGMECYFLKTSDGVDDMHSYPDAQFNLSEHRFKTYFAVMVSHSSARTGRKSKNGKPTFLVDMRLCLK